ncbi:hypothetical protein [Streptomyces sp. NRRL S-448]|uniref:hypothetical protein n=1 Tax=Streptomyces sp. NRRL S-448 TaxID=1463907 RepID=UPI000A589408
MKFVDPRDGSITLANYVTRHWQTGVRGAPGTVKRVDERVRLHVLPHIGEVALRDVSASVLRGYIATLEGECAPRYARQSAAGDDCAGRRPVEAAILSVVDPLPRILPRFSPWGL